VRRLPFGDNIFDVVVSGVFLHTVGKEHGRHRCPPIENPLSLSLSLSLGVHRNQQTSPPTGNPNPTLTPSSLDLSNPAQTGQSVAAVDTLSLSNGLLRLPPTGSPTPLKPSSLSLETTDRISNEADDAKIINYYLKILYKENDGADRKMGSSAGKWGQIGAPEKEEIGQKRTHRLGSIS
jgi:hypothetical protein